MESEKTFDLKTDGYAAFSRKPTHAFLKYDWSARDCFFLNQEKYHILEAKLFYFNKTLFSFYKQEKKHTSYHHSAFLTLHKPITLKSLKAN